MKLFKTIIDSIYKLEIPIGHITFSLMGEPLLDPYLLERGKYVQTLGSVEFYTNGKILTREKLIKIRDVFSRVYLSVHGNTPKEYENYTGNKFETIKKTAKMAREILGGKLIISNHPEGRLEPFLETKINYGASKHYIFDWGEKDIAKEIKSDKPHQIYCELLSNIIFRVDGSIATCCSDWNNENDFLNRKFPHCQICNNKHVLDGAIKSGMLDKKIGLLKELRKEIDKDG